MIQIPKEALDDYNGGPVVPAFQLQLKMIPSLTPTALVQKVGIVGVTPKDSFITITKEPPRTEGIIHNLSSKMLVLTSFFSFVQSESGDGNY